MIESFKCKETERVFFGMVSRKFPREIQQRALIKLRQIDASSCVEDLRTPPANRLKNLKGDRVNQMSIRINQQYRICFTWKVSMASEVEIVDYH